MTGTARSRRPNAFHRLFDAGYEAFYQSARAGSLIICRPLFRIRSVGTAPKLPSGPLIVCANHASYLDPAFVQLVIRRRLVFVMTNSFYRLPWFRWFFQAARAIPVASGRMAKVGLDRALAVLRQGGVIGIFPEGRLSTDGTLGPPQRGVSILARMGGAPVLPVGITGNLRAWPRGARRFRRSDVRVAFGPLIPAPPAQPAPGRAEEQAYARRIMSGVSEAMSRARVTNTPARPDGVDRVRSEF